MTTETTITLDAHDFKKRLVKIAPFISTEETRYYLNGVFMSFAESKLTLVATNGHILQEQVFTVESDGDGDRNFAVICPKGAVRHLITFLDQANQVITASVSTTRITFRCGDFDYSTKVIDGTYPDYKKVIPQGLKGRRCGLNATYVLDALAALGANPVNVAVDEGEVGDSAAQHLFSSNSAEGVRVVIMPMRWESGQ